MSFQTGFCGPQPYMFEYCWSRPALKVLPPIWISVARLPELGPPNLSCTAVPVPPVAAEIVLARDFAASVVANSLGFRTWVTCWPGRPNVLVGLAWKDPAPNSASEAGLV